MRDGLCDDADWGASDLDGSKTLIETRTTSKAQLPEGRTIVRAVAAFTQTPDGQFGVWVARCLIALLAIDREASAGKADSAS